MAEVLVQETRIANRVFRITANHVPSAAVPGTTVVDAEYYYVDDVRVERQEFVSALELARAADDQVHDTGF